MKKLCVFCGSSTQVPQSYLDLGYEVGKAMANSGIGLIYGAGSIGIMGMVADAVLESGGCAVGIIPDFMIPWEVCHQTLTELHITHSMHDRKFMMYDKADGFVALPGGMGTMEELCEILTWRQLGSHQKPVWILNFNGFYDGLIEHFNKLLQERFLSQEHFAYIQISSSFEDILDEFHNLTKEA